MRWLVLPLGALAGFAALMACGDSSDPNNPSNTDGGSLLSNDAGDPGTGGDPDAGNSGGGNGSDAGGNANGGDAGGTPNVDAGPAPMNCVGTSPYTAWTSDPKLCVYVFATGLDKPRQMAFAPNGDLFVNTGGQNQQDGTSQSDGPITVMWDANKDGTIAASEQATFASALGLYHGLAFSPDAKFLYASSGTTVYRWPYTTGAHAATAGAEVVVKNLPPRLDHITRTLAFDSTGRLYVSAGSSTNLELDSNLTTRASIRRYTIPATVPSGGLDYLNDGVVVASGMRNEVGVFIDAQDHIWGVENGRDDLVDNAHGGNIHNDNPGEEINFVDGQGSSFYGYPSCYSEYKFAADAGGKGPGTQWHDPQATGTYLKDDPWCQNTANVHPPVGVMQAHWAPLGVVQYTGNSLPFSGDLLIAAHGSWDRSPAVGRLIVRAHLQNGAVTSVAPIVGESGGANGGPKEGAWDARPVDVRQGPDQAIYFSDDQSGRIFKIGYKTP